MIPILVHTLHFSHKEGSNSSDVICLCIFLYIADNLFSTWGEEIYSNLKLYAIELETE